MGLMKAVRIIVALAALQVASIAWPVGPEPSAQMRADVTSLVRAARKLEKLWPWQPAIPEVALVAAHGRAVAPLLVAQLVEDPDNDEKADWNVQQQVALALCRIYDVSEDGGHVYMNRASEKTNAHIKAFWRAKVAEK